MLSPYRVDHELGRNNKRVKPGSAFFATFLRLFRGKFLLSFEFLVIFFLLIDRRRRRNVHRRLGERFALERSAIVGKFRKLFEQVPLGLALQDRHGLLSLVNPALASMLGYKPNEMTGMTFSSLSAESPTATSWGTPELAPSGSGYVGLQKTLMRKDGSRISGQLSFFPLNVDASGQPTVLVLLQDITARYEAELKLEQAESALHELPMRLISAQEQERQRIARELHDDIGQRLSLLMIQLDRLANESPALPSTPSLQLATVMQGIDEITSDVHQLSHELHSSKLQHLGLPSALKELCSQFRGQNVSVTDKIEDVPDLSPEVQLCFYRVAQEALNNVAHHSHASAVWVTFASQGTHISLAVRDNGTGFNPSHTTSGLGLASMRERVRSLDGDFTVTTREVQGTEVVATLPVSNTAMLRRTG